MTITRTKLIIGSITIGIVAVFSLVGWYVFSNTMYGMKHLGGSIHITQPADAVHIQTILKQDAIWHEYYLPKTNTCVTEEYTTYGIIQGSIIVDNCNYRAKI